MSNRRYPPVPPHEGTEGGSVFESFLVGVVRACAGLVIDWNQFQHVSNVRKQAQPGDVLEFQRGFYSHYALYLGNGKVMNIDAEDKKTTQALIRERTLEDVCGSSKVRVRNHEDVAVKHFYAKPKSVSDIIRSAKSFENQLVPYQFDFRKCEYYSTLWRYGKGFSTQAAKPTTTPAGAFVSEVANSTLFGEAAFNGTNAFVELEGYAKYKRLANN